MLSGRAALPPDLRDAGVPYQNRHLIDASLEQLEAERSERRAAPESRKQARPARLPETLPAVVLSAVYLESQRNAKPGAHQAETKAPASHIRLQARLAAQSKRGMHILARKSGHFIQLDEPDAVVQAIARVIRMAPPKERPRVSNRRSSGLPQSGGY
jgi:pimeloyl-ACP methyl ester carboxylesterase